MDSRTKSTLPEGEVKVATEESTEPPKLVTLLRILHVDVDTCFLKIAKPLLEMTGEFQVETATSVEEAIKKMKTETFDVIVSDYEMPNKDGLQFLQDLRKQGNSVPFILFTVKSKEEVAIRALELCADGFFNKSGNPDTVYAELAQGIMSATKCKRADQTPNQIETKYHSLFTNMLDGFAYCQMIFDEKNKPVDFVYLEINEAFEKLTGLTKKEVIGKKVTQAIPEIKKLNPELFEIYGKVAQTGKEEKFEIHFQPLNRWLSISAHCPEKGYFTAVFEDITEQKKALEKLGFQAQLLDSTGQAIIVADEHQIISYWNNGAKKLYGWSAAEAIGRTIEQVLSKDFSSEEAIEVSKRLMTGESWSSETEAICSDGSTVPIIVNRSPILNKSRVFVGSVNVVTDISDQKWMEKEIVAYADAFVANSQKIETLNEKLRVVGGLTRHDVRNKLAALNGNIYLLKRKISDNKAATDYVAEIENVSKQILEILEFERIYEQVGSEELTYVDVNKFFCEATELVSDFKGIKTKGSCEGLSVLADSLLRQLLYNLMDNTLKYGQKTTEIRLYYKEEAHQLVLIYEDNGVGVTEEVRGHLFEKGFGKGTGFGLYMIKRIVEGYGWTLEENGRAGEGARFTMTIPYGRYEFQTQKTQIIEPKENTQH